MEDIYGELDNYDTVLDCGQLKEENAKLQDCVKELNETIERLTAENETLSTNYKNLETNYSTLLMTARAEIERKTKMIATLNTEKNQLIFRHLGSGNVLHRNQLQRVIGKPTNEKKENELHKGTKRKIEDTKCVENKAPRMDSASDVKDDSKKESRVVIENKSTDTHELLSPKQCPRAVETCVKSEERTVKTTCTKPRETSHRQISRTIGRAEASLFSSDDVSEPNYKVDHRTKSKITEIANSAIDDSSLNQEIKTTKLQISNKHEINMRAQKYERPVSAEPQQPLILDAPNEGTSHLLKQSQRGHNAEKKLPRDSDEIYRKSPDQHLRRNRSPSPSQRYGKHKRDYTFGRSRSRNERQTMERYRQFWSPDLDDEDIPTKASDKDFKDQRRAAATSRDRDFRSTVPESVRWAIDRKNRTKSRDRRRLSSPPYKKEYRPKIMDRRRNEHYHGYTRTHSHDSRCHESRDRRPKPSGCEYGSKDTDKVRINEEARLRKEKYQIHGTYRDKISEGKGRMGQVEYNNEKCHDNTNKNPTCSEKNIKELQKSKEIRNCQSPDEGQIVEVALPVVNIKPLGKEELTLKDDPRLYSMKYFTDSEIERNKQIDSKVKSYEFKIRNRLRGIELRVCSFNDANERGKSLSDDSDIVNDIYMDFDTEESIASIESGEILDFDELHKIAFENKKRDNVNDVAQSQVPEALTVNSSDHNSIKVKYDDPPKEVNMKTVNNIISDFQQYKIPKKLNKTELFESPQVSKPYCSNPKVHEPLNNDITLSSRHRVKSEPKVTTVRTKTTGEFSENIRNCIEEVSVSRDRSPTPVPENAFDDDDNSWKSPQHEIDESLTQDLRRRLKKQDYNEKGKHEEVSKPIETALISQSVESTTQTHVAQDVVPVEKSKYEINNFAGNINQSKIDMPSIADDDENTNAHIRKTDCQSNGTTPGHIADTLLEMPNRIVGHQKKADLELHNIRNSSDYVPFNNNLVTSTPNPKSSTEVSSKKSLCIRSPAKQLVTCEESKINSPPKEIQSSRQGSIEPTKTSHSQPLKIFVRRRRVVVKK